MISVRMSVCYSRFLNYKWAPEWRYTAIKLKCLVNDTTPSIVTSVLVEHNLLRGKRRDEQEGCRVDRRGRVYQWRLVVFKVREEELRAWLPLYVRLKLFQGVLVNYNLVVVVMLMDVSECWSSVRPSRPQDGLYCNKAPCKWAQVVPL